MSKQKSDTPIDDGELSDADMEAAVGGLSATDLKLTGRASASASFAASASAAVIGSDTFGAGLAKS